MNSLVLTRDLEYLLIFSSVLLLPKLLLRFKIPSGITALILGTGFAIFDPNIKTNELFRFLSQIGITSLFVFSGLEVEFKEFKEDKDYLIKYGLKSIIVLVIMAFALQSIFTFSFQASIILALGLFTPSAGFIINTLHSFKMCEDQEYWIKSKAISKEVISILLMFFALQINNWKLLLISLGFFGALFFILPFVFRFYIKFIKPYAPNSEVPFLVVTSLFCGVISKELGAYYLVGAFIVGLIGSQFKQKLIKKDEQVLFTSLSGFFNVFLPFYFFYAGAKLTLDGFNWDAIQLGLLFLIILIPIRLVLITTSIKILLQNIKMHAYRISLSLMPTLIFGLVIAGILKEKNLVSNQVVYALIFYTLVSSLLPSILFPIKNKFLKD